MNIAKTSYIALCLTMGFIGIQAQTIEKDFETRRAQLPACYFEAFDDSNNIDSTALRCLKFLYVYMPLPDIADYSADYFIENVDMALKARREMPWGITVPEREFLHFVLPIRVNNENLDGHRRVFYDELKERVKGLSMSEAILEVNHWCHEKVTYQPSDARTRSPLAMVSSGIGRCGEESTFTVAALRAVGIPARQVYTPRWAHTDDNHAWVEAWADGQWHFLGACEPEAVLDLGWFNEPASRGMLMNTRTFGKYDGPEEKLLEADTYTEINVTENYAKVDTITVRVVDISRKPIPDAKVNFCLYNYAEFYPIAKKKTDSDGKASLVAGLGDLMIWAANDGNYDFKKVTVGTDREVDIVIDAMRRHTGRHPVDIVPPKGEGVAVTVPEALASINKARLAYEDSLRQAYVATFVDKSRGNRDTIDRFISGLDVSDKARGEALLNTLSDKDWTDVTYQALCDAMTVDVYDTPLYERYILSPRVYNEFLGPFRKSFLGGTLTAKEMSDFRADPSSWAKWVMDSISVSEAWQPASVHMSPISVWRLRHTDADSREVFFVAAARAMGIPARIDPVTCKPQYYDNGWCELVQPDTEESGCRKGDLVLSYEKTGNLDNPGYYTHFTLSKIENGEPSLLNYDEDATWQSTFTETLSLEAGEYMLVTGQRMADGGVLCNVDIFDIEPGERIMKPLEIRQDGAGLKVIGNFDAETKYGDLTSDALKSILSATGRGFYILGIVKDHNEPSNHAIRDIKSKKDEFESMGIPMIILFEDRGQAMTSEFIDGLPSNITIGWDIDGTIAKTLADSLNLGRELPIFVVADTFNRIVFASQGYTIGLGQQLLDKYVLTE